MVIVEVVLDGVIVRVVGVEAKIEFGFFV